MKRDLLLWTGLLTGPIVWLTSLEAKFALSWWVCASRWKPGAIATSAVALAITGSAGLLSWSQWQQLARDRPSAASRQISRPQAMAAGGMLLSAGFLIVLIAQSLPELLLGGCE